MEMINKNKNLLNKFNETWRHSLNRNFGKKRV